MPVLSGAKRKDRHAVLQDRRTRYVEDAVMMSSAPGDAGAAGVGADLRAARLRLGWSLADVAAGLRIRLAYLEALEAGRVSELPGTAYAVGFLRTYAASLGLDPDELSRRFKSEAREVTRRTELTFPAPVPERGVPAGAVVLMGVVLAVGAYIGWYRLSAEGRLPAEVVAPVPARLAPLAEDAIPRPPITTPRVAETPTMAAPAPAVPAPSASGAMVAAIPPSSAAAMSLPAPPQSLAAPSVAAVPAAAGSPPGAVGDDGRLAVRARADAWVQVRDKASGQVVLNKLMHAGDSWPVPSRPGLFLTTGNAGGTDLVVDGTVAPSIGASGAVRRDLPLDPDMIRDGKLPPPPARTATTVSPSPSTSPSPTPGGTTQ